MEVLFLRGTQDSDASSNLWPPMLDEIWCAGGQTCWPWWCGAHGARGLSSQLNGGVAVPAEKRLYENSFILPIFFLIWQNPSEKNHWLIYTRRRGADFKDCEVVYLGFNCRYELLILNCFYSFY